MSAALPIDPRNAGAFADDDPTGFFAPSEPLRKIKDVVHDLIPIYGYLNRFIDTEQFQRLRDIKQLGTSSYVWPSAGHSRFEHSLGVAHLARTLVVRLKSIQPELGITNRDVGCVEIAGLCHDLGHGPWSHVWDGIFMPKALKGCNWKHEQGSEMMFDFMVESAKIPISEKDARFIKALIAGEPSQCDPSEKRFLFDIVSNKRNGLDVDKFDYIQRDSMMTSEPLSFPVTRIIDSAKVLDDQICYNIKDANQVYRICQRRFELHKLVYNHKTARAIEYMIVDALLLAEPHMHIAERVFQPESFLYLTDYIMKEIEMSKLPELEESRKLLKRIKDRDLYRFVDNKNFDFSLAKTFKEAVTPQKIFDKIIALKNLPEYQPRDGEGSVDALTVDDIIVDLTMMHHGMKEHNPVDTTKFYSKHHPNLAMNAGPGDYSELRPLVHAENLLRIYTRKGEMKFRRLVKAGYDAVLEDMDGPDQMAVDPNATTSNAPDDLTQTPKASGNTPLPETPGSDGAHRRAFERVRSKNRFTSLPGTAHESSFSSSSRSSTLKSSDSLKSLASSSSDPSSDPFVTAVDLNPKGGLAEFFGDEQPSDSDASTVGSKRSRDGGDTAATAEGGTAKRRKEGDT